VIKELMDILIADDEPFIQRSLAFVLKREGFNVVTADNGQEALEKAKQYRPGIIFLDIIMPKINGFSVCRAIKSDETLKESHVIILTAKGQEVDREMGFREGADQFMTKPFSPREVVEKVRSILAKNE
jgi:two-component system, OmpR family, alkaline phosphatase synthesis response regulator PhoP